MTRDLANELDHVADPASSLGELADIVVGPRCLLHRFASHARGVLDLPADLVDRGRHFLRGRGNGLHVAGGLLGGGRDGRGDLFRLIGGARQRSRRHFQLRRCRRHGVDDVADQRFEIARDLVHALAAPEFRLGFDRGGLVGGLLGRERVLEVLERARHLADLVIAARHGDLDLVPSGGKRCDHVREPAQRRHHAPAQHHGHTTERPQQRQHRHAREREHRQRAVARGRGTLGRFGQRGIAHAVEHLDGGYDDAGQLFGVDAVLAVATCRRHFLVHDERCLSEIGIRRRLQRAGDAGRASELVDAGLDALAVGLDAPLHTIHQREFGRRERTACAQRRRQRGGAAAGRDAQILRRSRQAQQRRKRGIGIDDLRFEPVHDRLDIADDLGNARKEALDRSAVACCQRNAHRAICRRGDIPEPPRGTVQVFDHRSGIIQHHDGAPCPLECGIGRFRGLRGAFDLGLRRRVLLENRGDVGGTKASNLLTDHQGRTKGVDRLDRIGAVREDARLGYEHLGAKDDCKNRHRQHRQRQRASRSASDPPNTFLQMSRT
ncbi:hypothetical protein ABIC03_006501 [Bradyrhizobium sp. RT6a]